MRVFGTYEKTTSDQIYAGFVNTLQAALPTFVELWRDLQSVTDEDYKFFLAMVHSNPEGPIPAQQVLGAGDVLSIEERHIFITALREWVAKQAKEFQGTSRAHLIAFYVDSNSFFIIAQYVDYASQEVVDQLKAPALILAENLPADVTQYTMMIVGRNGIGKSCLVNETLKLSPEERLLEGISKTSHGKSAAAIILIFGCGYCLILLRAINYYTANIVIL